MRPNSKTYNPEHSSSFYFKPKFQDTDRWDHGGFDQLQTENSSSKYSKLKKSKRNVEEKTMAADSLNAGVSQTQTGSALKSDKWTHDKFQETVNQEVKPKEQAPEKPKRERKPDRALYNVRQRCGVKDEEKKLKETVKQPQPEKSLPSPQPVKDLLLGFGEKETYQFEDDKLSISNVSTAMSDRLKSWDEESYNRFELLKEKQDSLELIQSPKSSKKSEECLSEVLFEMMLQSEQGIFTVKVHKGEEDYLAFLNKLCCDHHLDARSALYFKINMLDMINEAGADNANVTTALDHLLDVNYRLLMYECGQSSEVSHLIAPYICEGFQDEYPVTSCFDDSADE